jgi:hypothetical protein
MFPLSSSNGLVIFSAGIAFFVAFLFLVKIVTASREDYWILFYFGEEPLLRAIQKNYPHLEQLPDHIRGQDSFLWKPRSFCNALKARTDIENDIHRVKGIAFYYDPPQEEVYKQFVRLAKDLGVKYMKISKVWKSKPKVALESTAEYILQETPTALS